MSAPTFAARMRPLLDAPLSGQAGRDLLAWARGVRQAVARSDAMIGILSMEVIGNVPVALARAVACGVDEALLDLAEWQAEPAVGAADLRAADATLRQAVQRGVAGARMRLVELRYFRRRGEADAGERNEAFDVLQAMDSGNARQVYLLGLLTAQGFGTPADPARGFALQQRAAAMGDADAQFELALHYGNGFGVAADWGRALDAFRKAAEAGQHRAMYNLGAFHATGRGVVQDMALAAQWYERAMLAGNAAATATLAAMLATGQGVGKDLARAAELFDLADYLGMDVAELRAEVGL